MFLDVVVYRHQSAAMGLDIERHEQTSPPWDRLEVVDDSANVVEPSDSLRLRERPRECPQCRTRRSVRPIGDHAPAATTAARARPGDLQATAAPVSSMSIRSPTLPRDEQPSGPHDGATARWLPSAVRELLVMVNHQVEGLPSALSECSSSTSHLSVRLASTTTKPLT